MDDILIKMQTTIAQQDVDISNLSDELYTQQKEMAQLREEVRALKQHLKSMADDGFSSTPPEQEPPPPHY